jgi:hypothetical protein
MVQMALRRAAVCAAMLFLSSAVLLAGCERAGESSREVDVMAVRAVVAGTSIAKLAIEVSGAGLPGQLRSFATVEDGLARGTVTLTPGLARTVTMVGYDENGEATHAGIATIDVSNGALPPFAITLRPRRQERRIEVTVEPAIRGTRP